MFATVSSFNGAALAGVQKIVVTNTAKSAKSTGIVRHWAPLNSISFEDYSRKRAAINKCNLVGTRATNLQLPENNFCRMTEAKGPVFATRPVKGDRIRLLAGIGLLRHF